MKYTNTYISAFIAGMCIALGGCCYLSVDNKVLGAFLFSLGLLTICMNEFSLFTGKVCFARTMDDVKHLIIIWIGNFVGCALFGGLIRFAKPQVISKAVEMCDAKLLEGWRVIPLGILCNVLIYFAVVNYKNLYDTKKSFLLIMCVMAFILCGFEHCVANMFYFIVAGKFNIGYLLLNTVGNVIGGLGISWYRDCIKT